MTVLPAGAPTALPAAPAMFELAPGVFAYLQEHAGWCVNNCGVIAGPDTTVVIDTCATEARTLAQLAAVADLDIAPVTDLVNTHFHGDHVFGNRLFPDRTRILAHRLTRADMAANGTALTGLWPDIDWGPVALRLPDTTFDDRLTLHNGRTVELIHLGPAHTRGDVAVWLPEERVLFSGDLLMSECTPFFLMGSLDGMQRAVEAMRALRPRVIVPGHGPIAGPALLDVTARYLDWIAAISVVGVRAGQAPLDVARHAEAPAEIAGWSDPERLVGNLHRAYAELGGAAPGEELDVVSVFGEMVTFNGGVLPHCAA
ncbi:putative Zn-dependent hydrolase [Nocardia nova SH22a]|uniref:Putative Zn-dependent hydrolase n=1 Tax=Nocardia nova SH22a TaxID=1415166 RepID=W5TA90_9NOCA|nr:MBL fold metallo-hydrolase [Nocardia nova]AHH15883.1 putative Zn-dependent hydrolase [Nocardia nova SH22a]